MSKLAVMCDRSHKLAPWGRDREGIFATAKERNYPRLLCQRWARAVLATIRPSQAPTRAQPALKKDAVPVVEDARVFRATQPRKRAAELVAEYKVGNP